MTTNTTTFDDVISVWHERVHCEMSTQSGSRCRRLAYWRVDLHGCERVVMCGRHKQAWLLRALAKCRTRLPACPHCGRIFESFDAACAVTPL